MAVNLSPYGGVGAQFFDNAGNVLTGGKIFTYTAGTTTNQPTYTTPAGNIFHSNPIILDASGRVPSGGEIWLTDGLSYKFVLKDSNDVLIATYDNVIGINSNFVNFTNQQEIQIATAGQTVFNLTTTTYRPGTNSLSVFVDGVNQYGPGAQYAYVETDTDTVTFVNGLHVGALVKFTTSQLNTSGGVDAQQVSYNPPFVGAAATNVEAKLAQTVSVEDFGAIGDGVTDDATAINNAVSAVNSMGGGSVNFEAKTYLVGATIALPDNVVLQGAGQLATIIKLKASSNVNIIEKKAGAVGLGAGLFDLTIDGNDTNNTNGGIYWAGASTGRGPSFTFERVTVTKCRPIASPPSSEYGAIVTTGSTWGVARDLDVNQNQFAVGWWHKGSDWQIDNFYLGPNGANYSTGTHSMIIQGGAGNLFSNCYFGGNGGLSQVFLWGTQRNLFVNCVNDNSWEQAYLFNALSGNGADNNRFLGGQIRGAGGKTNNTYAAVSIIDSIGNVFSDVEWSGNAHTSSANSAKYGLEEIGTSTGNYIVGGNLASGFLTAFYVLAAGSTTMVTSVFGWDSSDIQIATVKKRINVTGPIDNNVPSTSSVPLVRVNNGGAISLWESAYAYNYAWLQAIQDDGTNNLKPIHLNPLGGEVRIGLNGGGITVKSPNGLVTRTITIDNSGNIVAV